MQFHSEQNMLQKLLNSSDSYARLVWSQDIIYSIVYKFLENKLFFIWGIRASDDPRCLLHK